MNHYMVVLLHVLGINFIIENPARSTLLLHPWLRWAVRTLQSAGGSAAWFWAGEFKYVGVVKEVLLREPMTKLEPLQPQGNVETLVKGMRESMIGL